MINTAWAYHRKMIQTTQEDSMPSTAPELPTPTVLGRKMQLNYSVWKLKVNSYRIARQAMMKGCE